MENLLTASRLDGLINAALVKAARTAEYADLGGYDADPYQDLLNEIDQAIGRLKRLRLEVQKERSHEHVWNEDDYCSICRKDGRA